MKKIILVLAAFFVLSLMAFSVDATAIKPIEYPSTYPYHLCILTKEINTLEKYNEKSSEEIKNYFIFRKELNKIKQKESFDINILCQYNDDKEACQQCILNKFQELRWEKTKEQIIFYSVEGILLLILAGLVYLLIRIIRKPEIPHRVLKIILLVFGMIILILLFLIFIAALFTLGINF